MVLHPHHYTLSLFKLLLDKSEHTLLPPERLTQMRAEYEKLATNLEVQGPIIEETIRTFGKEIWPYYEGLEELYRRHGKAKEEALVRDKLSPELKTKYEQFLASGGHLADFRRGAVVETYFTPEEKFEIGQAVLGAHEEVLKEIASSCRMDKKSECAEVIEDHRAKLARIEKKLQILHALAEQAPRWHAEIMDKVKTFEEAFGYLAKTFHEEDVDGVIDYYQGVIESPEFE